MESVIKQAEEARNRARETAKLIHNNDYQPLKHDIDRMRREFLGLERLPELYEIESELISPEWVPWLSQSYWKSAVIKVHLVSANKWRVRLYTELS